MSYTGNFEQHIKNAALALNGQSVSVNLIGGQTLTGTVAYATTAEAHGAVAYPNAMTVTVSTKVHTVRMDHVSSIGQG
ncbi:hypothetical protein [Streptomyces sp. NPDC101178]|uniref:hypothetical protein n=1 Tax=Streptomyces sp. NPDC101178 TaxID=3366124 RepID=UPI0037FC0C9B